MLAIRLVFRSKISLRFALSRHVRDVSSPHPVKHVGRAEDDAIEVWVWKD